MLYYKNDKFKIYKQDNLEVLKQLPENYVDLIYCDILYNTGRKFKDYDDNLGTPQEAILWYEPRLYEMRRVLKETGSIYLHMDFRLVHYLKVKMDEIFGYSNFVNEIIWTYGLGNNNKKTSWQCKHDNILMYRKSSHFTWNEPRGKVTEEMVKKYCHIDENGKYMISYGKKYYLKGGKRVSDIWDDTSNLSATDSNRNGYDTQKPKSLLERIIKASSSPNDIVADFFMGSGTTGEASVELGRRFIGCDINERACEITKNRILNLKESA